MDSRIETDSLGSVEVPAHRYWGAQTQRSLENFAIGTEKMPRSLLRAYARLKLAAAETNGALGELTSERAGLIARAAREIIDGSLASEFPLSVWQTGSGTQTNMNLNEVLANRANELAGLPRGSNDPIHPNDHVNRCQSSNDTFPTAVHVAVAVEIEEKLFPAVDRMQKTLESISRDHARLVKVGRTHLQDAVPLSFGQEAGGWAAQLGIARRAIEAALPRILELAIGGTAVGTGLNAHPDFGTGVADHLARQTGYAFRSAPNKFAALAGHEPLVALLGGLTALATASMKIANDVRWLASGPRSGLGEIEIPANEPGSSIMPGKVNPTQSEALIMVCLQVFGNQTTVTMAASQGNFELNVCKPVIAFNVLQSIELMADSIRSFEAQCLSGLTPNREAMQEGMRASLMLVTALVPQIGYDKAARIAKKAHAEKTSLREAALELGITAHDFDAWVRPEDMLGVEPAGTGNESESR